MLDGDIGVYDNSSIGGDSKSGNRVGRPIFGKGGIIILK